MVLGEPVGYLQAWPRIWTRDYREQIQLSSGQSGTWIRGLRISTTWPRCREGRSWTKVHQNTYN